MDIFILLFFFYLLFFFSFLQVFSLLIFIAGGQSDRVYNKTRARQLRSKRFSESRRGVSRRSEENDSDCICNWIIFIKSFVLQCWLWKA